MALAVLWCGEPEAESIAEQLGDIRVVAPALLGFELANICLVKARWKPEQRQALTAGFRLRHQLTVEEVAVDHDRTLELASSNGLTACDASCRWFMRQQGAELVTLDQQLARADAVSRA